MRVLAIDLECYSELDIKKCGSYKYAEHAEILLFAYAFDDEPVHVIDFTAGETLPREVVEALTDPNVLKTAYNAAFEMNVITMAMGIPAIPRQWLCTMVQAYTLGLPGGLGNVGMALGLPEDKQKLSIGKRLIQYFCKPCKPTKANGGRTRNNPMDDLEKWELFKEYNAQDVEAERAIRKKIEFAFPNDTERKLWCLDTAINRRGVLIDQQLVDAAIDIDQQIKAEALQEAKDLTGMENPNSTVQIVDWFESQEGYRPDSVDKGFRAEYLTNGKNENVKKFFRLKNLLAKTSVKKYEAMKNMACSDNRVHGMLQFYGAQRTGRWAGRGVQLHNLPQNHLPDLDIAREIVRSRDYDNLKMFYDNPSDVLSQLIRTAFIAGPGRRFIVADFSAIEARVIAWLADEKWRQDSFANGKDIYCESASQMFGVPVVKHGINGELRAKGKIAELACIAEGELVLTNRGLKPIEEVSLVDKVWDGERFVQHEGVIYKGVRDVIEYEGLRATTDHLVFVEGQSEPVQFGIAAASGLHLIQTGNGWQAVRACRNNRTREKMDKRLAQALCADEVRSLWGCSMDVARKLTAREIERLSAMLSTEADSVMVGQTAYSSEATLRKSSRPRIFKLRCQGDKISVSIGYSGRPMDNEEFGLAETLYGTRPDRLQQRLCTGEFAVHIPSREQSQQKKYCFVRVRPAVLALRSYGGGSETVGRGITRTDYRGRSAGSLREKKELARYCGKAHVYDIRNAGQHHRYTVSDKLVHNCGYGGGVSALKAFGADKMGLSESEMKDIIQKWRKKSPHICEMWRNVEKGVKTAIRHKGNKISFTHGIEFQWEKGLLFITLPSGRRIAYVQPRIEIEDDYGKESVTYMGMVQGKTGASSWGKNYTWGGKLVENIVQATARDCLAVAMLRLTEAGYNIVMHVHDEVILAMPYGVGSLAEAEKIMGSPIDWAPGLLLNADGYETEYYKKD